MTPAERQTYIREIERCHLALRCRDEAPLWRVVWEWLRARLPIRGGRG